LWLWVDHDSELIQETVPTGHAGRGIGGVLRSSAVSRVRYVPEIHVRKEGGGNPRFPFKGGEGGEGLSSV